MISLTGKQRAHLKSLAMTMQPIFQLGKSSLTPENTEAISEALAARELIKINVLQNCMDDPNELAAILAERTHSTVVQVIGKKIVLYKEGKDDKKKIVLPDTKAAGEKKAGNGTRERAKARSAKNSGKITTVNRNRNRRMGK